MGVTGAGKSTLVKDYTAAFPRVDTQTGTRVPIFYMETPSPVTVKGMVATMLERLGDPAANRGTQWSLNSRLIKLIIDCEVELIILDDFHHLIDSKTDKVMSAVADWLKVLIKETGVPFLVVGIEGQVERILRANSQLSRLFASRERLQPFAWNLTNQHCLRDFDRFVGYAQEAVRMTFSEELSRAELLQRIHTATDGVVGNIMNLILCASMTAQESGYTRGEAQVIHLRDLARAFDRRLRQHLRRATNPFVVPTQTPPTPQTARGSDARDGSASVSSDRDRLDSRLDPQTTIAPNAPESVTKRVQRRQHRAKCGEDRMNAVSLGNTLTVR